MTDIKDLISNGKHFCMLPWIHFHSWPTKQVLPCCVADSNMPCSTIDPNQSILEMMNSEEYKALRLRMLNDEPSDACKRCTDIENLGTWTMRKSHNERRGMEYKHLVEQTLPDGSIPEFKMAYMDIRFSNICNMKCRSCGPSCSSQWAEEHRKVHGIDSLKKSFGLNTTVVNSNDDDKFWEKLKLHLDDVREVYFAGGEVLITPEHYECLEYWIENDLAANIELTYTTNFSLLKYKDKDLPSLWSHFPNLKIWASLDAHGKHAELMRHGTDWEKIEENLRRFRKLVPHAELQITPTISIWNVHEFPKFFDYLLQEDLINLKTNPRFNLATHPWFVNIQILPFDERITLAYMYGKYEEKYSDNIDLANQFAMIKSSLMNGKVNRDGLKEFIKYNDKIDSYRDEDILDAIPQLKSVYEWVAKDQAKSK